MTATQAAFAAGGVLLPLLTVAIGGLLLVFAMWWSYFKHEPDVGHHRSLRSMLGWGYGHYFVFAAVAALGAGLEVAADTTVDAADLGPAVAAATVAVPGRRSTWSRSPSSTPGACRGSWASWSSSSPSSLRLRSLRPGSASRRRSSSWPLLVCGLVALGVVRLGRRPA